MAIAVDEVIEAHEDTIRPDERRRWLPMGVFLIALILGGWSVHNWITLSSNASAADRDTRILDTSRRVVSQLVSLGHSTADEDLERIAADSTGSFEEQFSQVSKSFAQVLGDGQVESVGEVTEAGIVDSSDEEATVLAAVTSTVKNTEAPEGQPRVYRMKVSLAQFDGAWRVSDVEFVA